MLIDNETHLRLGFFFGAIALVALWEAVWPRRKLTYGRIRRWPSNLGLVAISTFFMRLLFPTTAVGFAILMRQHGVGFFNLVKLPDTIPWAETVTVIAAVLLLDLVIYLQHVAFHYVPLLWRMHRVHHTDLDFDVTTGGRFHPIEMIASLIIKLFFIALFGAPPLAVLIFEILLNTASMFNHGNIYLPPLIDRWLRFIFVTPDMHRIHHSIYPEETNSNFGFSVTWWDKIFKTYRERARDNQETMTIGIEIFRDKKHLGLHWLLAQPFTNPPASLSQEAHEENHSFRKL